MSDYNLFDLVPALSFDPPEKNTRRIKKALETELKNSDDRIRGENSNEALKKAYKEQRDYIQSTIERFFGKDGSKSGDEEVKNASSEYNQDAQEKKEKTTESLRSTVELLYETGLRFYTKSTINEFRNKTRLSKETIEGIFKEIGLVSTSIDAFSKDPKKRFPQNGDTIVSELSTLRERKELWPNGMNASNVTNLYQFAVYLCGEAQSVETFKDMPATELSDFFGKESQKAQKLSGTLYASLLKSLTSKAKSIFSSEEGKTAYNEFELYRSDELTRLFKKMKNVPRTLLLSDKFALPCIDIIKDYFPDAEVALAIYNTEAGFTEDEHYIFPNNVFYVKCPICQHVNKYESENEAQRRNSCQNCGKSLYKKCDKCKRLVLNTLDTCPYKDCGHVFANITLFPKLYQQAENSFRENDFDTARKYLFQAQSAAPGEKGRIDQLSAQIDKAEALLKEPINRLHQLIAERKYQTARAELGGIIKKYPSLNVSEFERTIAGELSKADALFSSTDRMAASQKADTCVSILMQCADHAPSLSFLRANAPASCRLLNITPVSDSGVINISWSRATEQGVTYRLIRKNDSKGSNSERDGDILLDNTTATSYVDQNVKAGKIYSYTVFTMRAGVFSAPISKSGMLYSDVRNCHVVQRGSSIRISWDSPENSSGATVYRISGGKTTVLADSAHGSIEDTNAQFGTTYTYKVCANYGSQNKSPGVETVITPLIIIDSFSIRASQVRDNIYKITWSIKQKGIDLRIQVNNKLVAEAKSEDGDASVSLPKDTYCTISATAFSGGKWLGSDNSIGVNTYSSCGIDKKATEIEENMISGRNGINYRIDLKIRMSGSIPSSVVGFYYAVRTSASAERWAKVEDVGRASDIQKVAIASYENRGFIPYQDFVVNETAFFVSVFTIHELNGRELVSEPAKLKVERPLLANLFWSVSYGLFDGLKLYVEMQGNRPIEYVPELYLCVCDSSQFIASYDDKNAQVIMRIPPDDLDSPQSKYIRSYSVNPNLPKQYLKKCKYFLFEPTNSGNDSISLRWKQGFTGKV